MKRIVSLLLMLCLLASSCVAFAEGTWMDELNAMFPVVDEPVTVKIAVQPNGSAIDFDPEKNWMCVYLSKVSGVNIEWQVIEPATADERVPMMLNSGDMPDAIIGHWFDADKLVKYGESEMMFYPVNKLLQYMPVLSQFMEENPAVKAGLTANDGNIYGFPAICNVYDYPQRFWINSEWLQEAGLEVPKTLADLKEMLVAFKNLKGEGNLPWAISTSSKMRERMMILGAYGYVAKGDDCIAIDYSDPSNPQIIYTPLAEHYKDYVTFMNGLWTEGLLDPDMMTKTDVHVQANVLEGVVGFVAMNDPKVFDPENYSKWIAIDVLVDNEGDTPVFVQPAQIYVPAEFVINADCSEEKAIALAKLADVMYTPEWYAAATYGPEAGSEEDYFGWGHYYPEVAEGDALPTNVSYNRPDGVTSDWVHRVTNLSIISLPGFNMQAYDTYKAILGEKYPETAAGKLFANGITYDAFQQQMIDKQSPYYVDGVPKFFTTVEDMERLAELKTPLDDYVANMEAKFITGELSIEKDWDAFIETLLKYGAQEYQDIYTKYYDAYKLNK